MKVTAPHLARLLLPPMPDEYVIGVYGCCGNNIDSIAIRTNKRTSPVYGGGGGERDFKIEIPAGNTAIGFARRSGELLDAIGLIYEKTGTSLRNIIRRIPGRDRF